MNMRRRNNVSGKQDQIPYAYGHGYMVTSNGKGKVAIYIDSEPATPSFKMVDDLQELFVEKPKNQLTQ